MLYVLRKVYPNKILTHFIILLSYSRYEQNYTFGYIEKLPINRHEWVSEVAQSCPTLCDPMDCSLPGSSVHGNHHSQSEVTQSCPTLCDPMDCSLPGSSIHGIFQAGAPEWVAISFSTKVLWFVSKKFQGSHYSGSWESCITYYFFTPKHLDGNRICIDLHLCVILSCKFT